MFNLVQYNKDNAIRAVYVYSDIQFGMWNVILEYVVVTRVTDETISMLRGDCCASINLIDVELQFDHYSRVNKCP